MGAMVIIGIITFLRLHSLVQGFGTRVWSENEATNPNGRVLFGEPANVFEFPFAVSLSLSIRGGMCGGSIIAEEWVISAGHCLYNVSCSDVRIFPAVWPSSEFVKPVECLVHPEYNEVGFGVDLSLLRVPPDSRPNDLTKIIPLPPPGTVFAPGTPAIIIGWGQMENDEFPNHLLRADVAVEDWNVCNEKYKAYGEDSNLLSDVYDRIVSIPKNIICTQGKNPRPGGACFGDSGGPVIVGGFLAGVISFVLRDGNRCRIGTPCMHAKVVDSLPWIYSHIAPGIYTPVKSR